MQAEFVPVHRHFVLHKPYGYLSQFKYELKRKKKLLGELYPFPPGAMAVGRLDEDSEGMLLITTDGKLSDHICSSKVEKEYYVQVDGLIDEEACEKLRQGVEIGYKGTKYITRKCRVFRIDAPEWIGIRARKIRDERHGPTSWISITIREGKFRQVRKMTSAAGFPTLRLIRVRVGSVSLDGLQSGEVLEVSHLEV